MAARWKEIQSEEEISELTTTLKPVLGIPPLVYVPALWASALVIVLLAVLVLPGIRNPGEEVTINSAPEGAAIVVDGRHRGTTPETMFLSAGDREIVVTAGTARERIEADIGRRVVGSLFVPKRREYTAILSEPTVESTIKAGVTDFAQWSLMGEPSPQFQYAPVAHDTARRLWASTEIAAQPPADHDQLNQFRSDLVAHVGSWNVRDMTAAVVRSSNAGALMTPGAIAELVRFFVHLDNNSPAFGRLVWELVPADEVFRAPLTDSSWADARLEALSTALLAGSLAPDERAVPSSRTVDVQGMRFAQVPEGSYILGYPLRDETDRGVPVQFDEPFWIQDRELTRRDFARFVQEESRWAPDNREALQADGLVQAEYLADWPDDWDSEFSGAGGEQPLRYVSWYAIDAFVRWMNARERPTVPDVENAQFVVPSAAQWEYAAFLNDLGDASTVTEGRAPEPVGSRTAGALGIFDLPGNVWEWTRDWHANHYWVLAPTTGDQRIVAGGSFATGETGHNLLGAQPPDWTTPFLGARLAIIAEDREVTPDGR